MGLNGINADYTEDVKLGEHEEMFDVKPVGIKYVCEHCNEGEMIAVHGEMMIVPAEKSGPFMIKHRCNKCGGTLMLPKTYPYIQWIPVNSIEEGSK